MRVLKHLLSLLHKICCKLTLIVIVTFISTKLTYMLSLLGLSWVLMVSCMRVCSLSLWIVTWGVLPCRILAVGLGLDSYKSTALGVDYNCVHILEVDFVVGYIHVPFPYSDFLIFHIGNFNLRIVHLY